MGFLTTAGGRITCLQCRAKSKRTLLQCRAPAMKGKEVCRFHGGLSTGPTSVEGKRRCASAKTVHGTETRQIRAEVSAGLLRVAILEALGRSVGIFDDPDSGSKNAVSSTKPSRETKK